MPLVIEIQSTIVDLLILLKAFLGQNSLGFRFRGYSRLGSPPISSCSNEHLTNSEKWAPLITLYLETISKTSEQKHYQAKAHDNAGDAKAKSPTQIVLDVVQYKQRHQNTSTERKVPPVEERALGLFLYRILLIKLVGSKSLDARLMPSLGECN